MDNSDSKIQIEIEKLVVESLSKKFNCNFSKKANEDEIKFEFDFINFDKLIIGEVYAGIDNLSSGARKKIIADCFKLVLFEKLSGKIWNKKLVFIDYNIASKFKMNNWISKGINEFNIEISVVEIDHKKYIELKERRKLQITSNIKKH